MASDQLKQLQQENNQLLSLTAEQTEDVQQTRTWLANTKVLLAEKEHSRLIALDKCDKVREATRHIEKCVKNEREERLNVEEGMTKSELQKEGIKVEILEEILFQDDLRARLQTLELTLEQVDREVDNERKNQEELSAVLASVSQEGKEIKSYSNNLDIENIQLKAEEITHSDLSFQNKARQELQKSSLREIDELKHKITKKKQEVRNLQSENDGLNSYIRGKKAKMVSTSHGNVLNIETRYKIFHNQITTWLFDIVVLIIVRMKFAVFRVLSWTLPVGVSSASGWIDILRDKNV